MKMSISFFIFLLLLNCQKDNSFIIIENEPEEQFSQLFMKTDKNSYLPAEKITFTVHNPTDSPAYFEFCGPNLIIWIDKNTDNEWTPFSGTICIAIYPILNRALLSADSLSSYARIDEPGLYRLHISYDWTDRPELSESLFSNEFQVMN